MQLTNTKERYGAITKSFHWLLAILIVGMLCVGFFMGDIASDAVKGQVIGWHKLTGVMLFFLFLLWGLWALISIKPELPNTMPNWEQKVATSSRILLYILPLLMALSGWIMATAAGKPPVLMGELALPFPGIAESVEVRTFARNAHGIIAYLLVALFSLHTLAALKHHFISRNNVLRRMLSDRCS